jgi:ribokinase
VYTNRSGTQHIPAFDVKAVDTVAAGDAFNGGLTAGLYNRQPLETAILRGMAAAAFAVTRPGAQSAMPTGEEVDRFMREYVK